MKEMSWYFPTSLQELAGFLDKAIPHGGGTSILRMDSSRLSALIDLRRLPLHYFKQEKGIIRIGAAQTYSSVFDNIKKIDREHILAKALGESACESLRNRITVGGSIATFRPWSDIMGPLLALDSQVALLGKHEGTYSILQYIDNADLKKESLIREVSFRKQKWNAWYHRATRTNFDYAIYTITMLLRMKNNNIDDIRIFVVGTKKRFMRLSQLEESLRDKPSRKVDIVECVRSVTLDFHRRQRLDTEYIEHLVKIQLARGLTELLRR